MEVVDSYQEYVEARRQDAEREKISTLVLPEPQMASIGTVIAEAVMAEKDNLSPDAMRKWTRILEALERSVLEAE